MSRTRLSTTVDEDLLQAARRVRSGDTDAAMIDEALRALVARHRSAEVEASYTAYDDHPLDEPDEWRDLASFRGAARVRSSAVSADWGALSIAVSPDRRSGFASDDGWGIGQGPRDPDGPCQRDPPLGQPIRPLDVAQRHRRSTRLLVRAHERHRDGVVAGGDLLS